MVDTEDMEVIKPEPWYIEMPLAIGWYFLVCGIIATTIVRNFLVHVERNTNEEDKQEVDAKAGESR